MLGLGSASTQPPPRSGPGWVRQVVPGDRPAVTSTAGPAPASAPDGVQPGQGQQEALQHQPAPLRLVGLAEDAVHYLVTLLLFGVAAVVLYRTARALFDTQLIIGIVSATREILTVGARLSLAGDKAPSALRDALLELGVNAGVVLGLATALVLIRRGAGMRET